MACLRPISTESGKSLDSGKGQKSIIEIYTDWANHYLEKTKGKRRIVNLQTELSDGVVLCEVIEAVTQQKVPDVNKKPKNNTIIITNIQACLNFLRGKGVTVDEIKPEDIRDGNLKSILSLFFQLSRYKQQQKQQLGLGRSSIPNSPAKSSIPVPGQVLASPKRTIENKSESRIPGKTNGHYGSGIARPGGCSDGDMPPIGRHNSKISMTTGVQRNGNDTNNSKQSMLDRFKIGRNSISQPSKPGLGKRTSSSSGFSSARSDRSESSISLSSDTNFPSPSALRRIQEAHESIPASEQQHVQQSAAQRRVLPGSGSGIRSRFSSGNKEKSSSPKRSPRLGRSNNNGAAVNAVTEIKDYGSIDENGSRLGKPEKYPPHAYSRDVIFHSKKSIIIRPSIYQREGTE
jgi:neuron navigator 2